MAFRINQLFQFAPESYLERTVLFSDGLASFESSSMMANRQIHHVDIEPLGTRARIRLLPSFHAYFQHSDMPMVSYVIPMEGTAQIPKNDPPQTLVFVPEFTGCRLLIHDDEALLRLSVERNLNGMQTPPETEADSRYCDSINYWEFATKDLVGNIRATAVVFKERGKPWRFAMQQIVGAPGAEVVRKLFARDLKYSEPEYRKPGYHQL